MRRPGSCIARLVIHAVTGESYRESRCALAARQFMAVALRSRHLRCALKSSNLRLCSLPVATHAQHIDYSKSPGALNGGRGARRTDRNLCRCSVVSNPSRCSWSRQRVDGFSNRDSARSQNSEVLGRLDGDVSPDETNDRQRCQQLLSLVEILDAAKTLKDFGQNQISGRDRLVTEEGVQSVRL
jgi:hypothetical protein